MSELLNNLTNNETHACQMETTRYLEHLNLAWLSATINSFLSVLVMIIYYKICLVFTGIKSRNWLTIIIFVLIYIDIMIGLIVMF